MLTLFNLYIKIQINQLGILSTVWYDNPTASTVVGG